MDLVAYNLVSKRTKKFMPKPVAANTGFHADIPLSPGTVRAEAALASEVPLTGGGSYQKKLA